MAPHPLLLQKAPAFTLPSTAGDSVTITPGSTGKPLVIFFYPGAGQPVCTKEACAFRDSLSSNDVYKNSSVEIVGISADTIAKNKSWADSNQLTYAILSDTDRKVRKEYQVNSVLFGISDGRYTFCIDPAGIIQRVETATLSAAAHSKAVDEFIAELAAKE